MGSVTPINAIPVYDPSPVKYVEKKDGEALRLDFLQLLTKQLEFQDPMEPMENNEFTAQLASFSGLEAQTQTNTLLQQMLQSQSGFQLNQAVGYLGRSVVTDGNDVGVSQGKGLVSFELDGPANVTIDLLDSAGRSVRQTELLLGKGTQSVAIDDPDLEDGTYRAEITALGMDGSEVAVTPFQTGVVDEVVNSDQGILLSVNGKQIDLSLVRRIA